MEESSSATDRWQPGMPMRYCPHCTHPLEERLAIGRIRRVCLACGFVHLRDPKVGVTALVEEGGQVLLVQRAIEPGLGLWSLPSGYVEWDESPEQAVRRECAEETGLSLAALELLDVQHYTDDFRGPGINLVYRARVGGGRLRPADDARDVRFAGPSDLPPPEQIAFVGHRQVLERWRNAQPGGL